MGGFPHIHGTAIGISPNAEKLRIALDGHFVFGTETLTWTGWLGDRIPPDGLKLIPFNPIPEADHFRLPSEPEASAKVPVQVQPEFELYRQSVSALKLFGLNDQADVPQSHSISVIFPGPLNIRSA